MLNKIKSLFQSEKTSERSKNIHSKVRTGSRYWQAASQGSNLTASWSSYKYTADELVERFHTVLVARSTEQCFNNPYARKFLQMLKTNIVGPNGIQLNAQSKDPNGNLDSSANLAIETGWEKWGKNCEITGKYNWLDIQNLSLATAAREGECIVRILRGKQVNDWGFALQIIDPRRLDVYKNEKDLGNGNFIRFGIEFNQYGKPLYYHLINNNDPNFNYYSGQNVYQKVPASEIIHIFLPEMIDQKRGFPWTSTALMRMNMLGGYEDAAIAHARAGACQMGIIENPDIDNIDSEEEQGVNIEAEPASFVELPPGYQFKQFNPNYPSGEFDPFTKACLRGISSGLGVNYNNLSNDLSSVNFSSLRQGTLDERDFWMFLQSWFTSSLHEKVFAEWIKYSLLARKITFPKGNALPAEKLDKFSIVKWQPRRWQWIDPQKDINAAILAVENNVRSRSDIIREQGRDPEQVWNEIDKENKLLSTKQMNEVNSNAKSNSKTVVSDGADTGADDQ